MLWIVAYTAVSIAFVSLLLDRIPRAYNVRRGVLRALYAWLVMLVALPGVVVLVVFSIAADGLLAAGRGLREGWREMRGHVLDCWPYLRNALIGRESL